MLISPTVSVSVSDRVFSSKMCCTVLGVIYELLFSQMVGNVNLLLSLQSDLCGFCPAYKTEQVTLG